jgi:hypothetical protein
MTYAKGFRWSIEDSSFRPAVLPAFSAAVGGIVGNWGGMAHDEAT